VLGLTEFAGEPIDSDSVLIKYTYKGDATLDGMVDIRDLYRLAVEFNTSSAAWTSGDFNFDGTTDAADLGLLSMNWQAGVAAPLGQSLTESIALVGLGNLTVPEPSISCLLLAAFAVCRRRRR
jgi:hypothetical protein